MAAIVPLQNIPIKYRPHVKRYITNVNLIIHQYNCQFVNTRSTQEIDFMISDVTQLIEKIKDSNTIFSNDEIKLAYKDLKSKYKKIYTVIIHSQPF